MKIITVSYREYKNNPMYANYEPDGKDYYNAATKTIRIREKKPVVKKNTATLSRQLIAALSLFSKTGLTYIDHDGKLFQNGMGGAVDVMDETGKKRTVCIDVYDKYAYTADGEWKNPFMAESVLFFGNDSHAVANCDFFIMVNLAGTHCVIAKREAFNMDEIKFVGGKACYITRDYQELDLED